MAYVKTVTYEEANREVRSAYEDHFNTRGWISNITAVNAIRPHVMKSLANHHRTLMFTDSGLSPAEREMIATVVSSTNQCQY